MKLTLKTRLALSLGFGLFCHVVLDAPPSARKAPATRDDASFSPISPRAGASCAMTLLTETTP